MLSRFGSFQRLFKVFGFLLTFPTFLFAQNSLNSGDFSTGSWGVGQAMSTSAGGSLIITKGVTTSGNKFFRFFGDGSPCGEYQPNTNGDAFTHDVVVTNPNANCGSANAWQINVPSATSNVVFKTDGGNDGIDRSIAFVVQGAVQSVSSVTRAPAVNVYPGQDVTVTANLTADFSTGQAAWLRYTNDAFATSTVVKMTGTGTTRTANIPGATNAPSTAVAYYVFTSSDGASISPADADFYTINLNNNGGSNYTYTTQAGWTTIAAGSWSTPGTWNAGIVPPTNTNMGLVTLAHAVTLNQNALVGSLTVNAGITFTGADASPRTLSIAAGGAFTKTTTAVFTPTANNTVTYTGAGTFAATTATTFQNLQVGGALSGTGVATSTINGTFQINSGGSISAAPLYATNSTLTYNTGGSYNVGNEWTSAVTTVPPVAGRPFNVTVTGSTNVTSKNINLSLYNDLTINNLSTLNLNATSGDLLVVRNWINNGTFNANNRAVQFVGTSINSTITNPAGENFSYLIFNKTTAGTITLLNNINITGNGGDVLQFLSVTAVGQLDLNGNSLTISGTSGNIYLGNTAAIPRQINATGSGTVFISNGTKIVTKGAAATTTSLAFATTVTVRLSNGLNCGTASFTTVNGTLQIDNGGFISTNAPIYGTASTLVYNSGTTYGASSEWTAGADGAAGLGLPNNVTIQNSTTLNMAINFKAMAGNLTIGSGCGLVLNASAGDLSLRGNWVNNGGTFTHNNRNVLFRGATATTTVLSAGQSFYTITVDKGAGAFNIQLLSSMTITHNTGSVLTMAGTVTNGSGIDLNGFDLTLSGSGGNIDLGAGTALNRNILGTGNIILSGGAKSITRTTTNTLTTASTVTIRNGIALTLSAASILTLNGTLRQDAGSSIVTNAPVYGLASTLIYNQSGAVAVGTEWTVAGLLGAATIGRPANVTIQNSTDLTMTTTDRSLYGNLNISSGSLTLSAVSGNLFVGGNWTRAAAGANFTQNGRTVSFWAVAPLLPTTITRTGGETFGNVTLAKTAGIAVNLANDVTITGLLTFTTGTLSIGSNTLTLNGTTSGSTVTSGFSGTANSTLNIGGATTTFGTIAFVTGVQTLGTLTINRTGVPSGTAAVTLNSGLTVNNGSGLNNSVFNLTSGVLAINAGFTLTVANTSTTGASASNFVFAATTARFAYLVTGAGTYTLTFPVGTSAVTSPTQYRPLIVNSLVQSATNTYSAASTAGPAASAGTSLLYTAPIVGVSSVRYYPFTTTTIGNLTSIGSVSIDVGADEVSTIDNLVVSQVIAASWQNLGASGTTTKTSTVTVGVASAATYFALGFNKLAVVFLAPAAPGSDANTGQTSNNIPAGSGPKLTMASAISAVAEGGTIQTTAAGTFGTAYTLSKNINITSGVGVFTITGVANVTTKAVFPFLPTAVNTGSDAITLSAHQLATGMPVTYNNYGAASGLMPGDINPGTDILTVGSNIPTGQPVIYQAYPSAGAAGGLVHGTTYFAINLSATTIQLASTYANALAGTPIVDITSVGSALSHGVISSVAQGLTAGTLYFAIVVDANTIKLASSNANALAGTAIDLQTIGGGNHVVYFTPTYAGPGTFAGAASMTITEPQSHINGYLTLTGANPTITMAAGTYSMQPTINITKTMTLNGAGIGSTIFDGKGKISSATTYHGINLSGIAAGTVTISNLKIGGYYNGIDRTSATASANTNIDNVESSDNFSRGINFEGAGAISTTLNIRNGICNNNNGVGVNSYGINISGMSKTGVNIRNMTLNGNRNSGIEIESGATVSVLIRGNTISGVNAASPLSNSVTEFGIGFNGTGVVPTGATAISNNAITVFGRAGIECKGCVGNGSAVHNAVGAFRIAGNYIVQGSGAPFSVDPAGSTPAAEIRDIAGIAVGNINAAGNPSLMVIDTNQVEGFQQPNSSNTDFTAFGIVSSGNGHQIRMNIVTGCEVGIQAQQGSPGTENTFPDNFYNRDATATSTGYLANRNSITGNDLGARNQGLTGSINFLGNWWGHINGPTHASNTDAGIAGFGAGAGETVPAGAGIAYNANLDVNPDDNVGTASGQRGIQVTSAKSFRLKPTANSVSLATPNLLNQGVSVGFSSATTGFTDILDICPVTYTLSGETVILNKRINLRGNFGSGTKPLINGTGDQINTDGDVAGQRMQIAVNSQQVIIENLRIEVDGSSSSNTRSCISTNQNSAASIIDGLIIRNNEIINTNTIFANHIGSSFGIYLKERSFGVNDPSIVLIDNNQITNGDNTFGFGVGVRTWGLRTSATNNTIKGGWSIRNGTPAPSSGVINFTNNDLYGMVEYNSPVANSTTTYSGNDFFRNPNIGHVGLIEVRLNKETGATVNISNNTFNEIGEAGYPYWGILSLRSRNLNILNNVFTPAASATDFCFIHASTRQQGTKAGGGPFHSGINIKGNEFNGNAQASTSRTAISLARHSGTVAPNETFTSIAIGGALAEANTFKSNLGRFIELDPYAGAFGSIGAPYSGLTGSDVGPSTPFDVSFDASQNIYGITSGQKRPTDVGTTMADLFEIENKIQHKIDYDPLGFVTVKPLNAYVTTSSFLSGYSTEPAISRAITAASDGWTINTQSHTYPEAGITINKNLTFANNGTTVLKNVTMNGSGKTLTLSNDYDIDNASVLTLTDGNVNTGSNILTLSNATSGAISNGGANSHVVGNLKRAIVGGVLTDYMVGTGSSLQRLSIQFSTDLDSIPGLTDVTVRYTNANPGTNVTPFSEDLVDYDSILPDGYWIVTPNIGGDAFDYSMRLYPTSFAKYPPNPTTDSSFTILKRVGLGSWVQNGVWTDPPGSPVNRVFADGSVRRSGMRGFSNFGIGSGEILNVPLSLHLISFQAFKKGMGASLNWKTASEKGISHFELQRSLDGKRFETFEKHIPKSETGREYEAFDSRAFQFANNEVFYRLKSTDDDGTIDFSNIEKLRLREIDLQFSVSPNPVKDKFFVKVKGMDLTNAEIKVSDSQGRIIPAELSSDGSVDISRFSNGLYHISIRKDDFVSKGLIIKE